MENVYEGGKIYKISTPKSNKFYIGSTTKTLNNRFSIHKACYKMYKANKLKNKLTVFDLFDLGECSISLVEDYPCLNKKDLLKREGEVIRQNKEHVINKIINGRSEFNYKDNPDRFNLYKLKWALKYYNCPICNCEVQNGNRFNHQKSQKHKSKIIN